MGTRKIRGGNMKILRMHVTQEETHRLLRPALERVLEFTKVNGSEANPDILFAELASAYFQPEPITALWVGVDDFGIVVAHMIVTVDEYYGGRFLTIHQLWKNSNEEITLQQRQEMIAGLKKWGVATGCGDIRVYAINENVAKVFEEGYGFARTERVMLKIPIEKDEEN